jgi:hypothetical protein
MRWMVKRSLLWAACGAAASLGLAPMGSAYTLIELLTPIGEAIADAPLRQLVAAQNAANDCAGESDRLQLRLLGQLRTALRLRDAGQFDYHIVPDVTAIGPSAERFVAVEAANGSGRAGEPFVVNFPLVGRGAAAGSATVLQILVVVDVDGTERKTLDVRDLRLVDPCDRGRQPSGGGPVRASDSGSGAAYAAEGLAWSTSPTPSAATPSAAWSPSKRGLVPRTCERLHLSLLLMQAVPGRRSPGERCPRGDRTGVRGRAAVTNTSTTWEDSR